MQLQAGRLQELLADEAEGVDDYSPAGEPAIRAHLRLVAEALAETAGPATRAVLEAVAAGLPERFNAVSDELDHDLGLLGGAAEHELDLQFGADRAPEDPKVREVTDRRLRVQVWVRFFLRRVGEAIGDGGFADEALGWMADRQTQLADTIFTMDRRAKEAQIARHGPDAVDDPGLVNQIGQAAMLQANIRFMVEAIAATLVRRQAASA